ncbi:MAG: permease-like cell division protein FtsX [Oscillospiraceae bacterium]|nr:permease-like cell division protein FtsX [Oscillospiraceae bacterium]
MKVTNLGYLMKEGIRGIFLHGFMSFAAVLVTVACLVIVGGFSAFVYNANIIVEDLNKTNEVVVYIESDLTDAEARSIGTVINQIPNVYQADFKSRETALEEFAADYQDSSVMGGLVPSDLRHRYVVMLENNELMEETVGRLEKVSGVVWVNAPYELAEGFITLQNLLHIVSVVIIVVLLVVSLLIISNTVKLAMYDRKEEISIMKMVGATNGFIRLPFVVEGFALGMLGATVAFFILWTMYNLTVSRMAEADTLQLCRVVPYTD